MGATNFKGGIAEDGVVTKRGAGEVTGATLVVATGLTTITGAVVTINEDPGAGAGDVYQATATFSGGNLTIAIWQDDSTAATEDTFVSWIAWGTV
jgi:hypothetical protein